LPIFQFFFRVALAALFSCALLLGCDESPRADEPLVLSGDSMGTRYNIKYFAPENKDQRLKVIAAEIKTLLDRVEGEMSHYLPDSDIARLNVAAQNQWVLISPATHEVIKAAIELGESTQGALDIGLGSLINGWGFGPDEVSERPGADDIAFIRANSGYQHLRLRGNPSAVMKSEDVLVDLSAIAKGYAVDQLAELLDSLGIVNYLIELGGEIRAAGEKADGSGWRIAIESPIEGSRQIYKVLELRDFAVATSGDYRNFYVLEGQRFSHTIDPNTGYPVTHSLASTTVLHASAMVADGLATAFMVMGVGRALEYANLHSLAALFIIRQEGEFVEMQSNAFSNYRLEKSDSRK